MAKKAMDATKRTKVKEIPKSKEQITGKDMRKIKGGLKPQQAKVIDKTSPN